MAITFKRRPFWMKKKLNTHKYRNKTSGTNCNICLSSSSTDIFSTHQMLRHFLQFCFGKCGKIFWTYTSVIAYFFLKIKAVCFLNSTVKSWHFPFIGILSLFAVRSPLLKNYHQRLFTVSEDNHKRTYVTKKKRVQ